ncbi:MAG: hypothetical protein GQ570_07905 [Helicobacteraceae bacterium]|nr:hypothetical protein [Helicobacteraceae bacterium]
MQPLTPKVKQKLLKRFNNFCDSEIRAITIVDPITINIEFSLQDENRAFDWINLKLEFSEVSNATLVDNAKLTMLDMSEGMSLLFEDTKVGFGLGEYDNISSLQSSQLFFIASSVKYKELEFAENIAN